MHGCGGIYVLIPVEFVLPKTIFPQAMPIRPQARTDANPVLIRSEINCCSNLANVELYVMKEMRF